MTPGSRADTFTVKAENKTKTDLAPLKRVIVIRLAGLPMDAVRISRGLLPLAVSGSTGQVVFTDQLQFSLRRDGVSGDSATATYSLQFLSQAPGGRATITAEVFNNTAVMGTDSDTITIKGAAGTGPTPTKTPGSTDPGVVPTFETQPPISLAPLDASDKGADLGGAPVALYVTGGLLVAAGGATLWLLFRKRPELANATVGGYPVGDYEAAAPTLGYPAAHAAPAGGTPPTAVMPAVRNPSTPPPADPWSSSAPPHP
jgi:hypothetical protein